MRIVLVDKVWNGDAQEYCDWKGAYCFVPEDRPPYRTLYRRIEIVRNIPIWMKLVVLLHETGHLAIDVVTTILRWKPIVRMRIHLCYDDVCFLKLAEARTCLIILVRYPSFACRGDQSDFPAEPD